MKNYLLPQNSVGFGMWNRLSACFSNKQAGRLHHFEQIQPDFAVIENYTTTRASIRHSLITVLVLQVFLGLPHFLCAQDSDLRANERVFLDKAGDGDFPARRLGIGVPALRFYRVESDEFNSFVPGLSTLGQLTLQPSLQTPYAHIPYLRRGDSLEQGDLVIGRVLGLNFTFGSSFVFTDNVYRERNKQSDLIIQTVLGITANLQLTENLQLVTSGNIAYYRAMGNDDVSAYGFRDEFYFSRSLDFDPGTSLDGNLLFASQFDWSRQSGAWGFGLADRFSVTDKLMAEPFVDNKFERTTEVANSVWASVGRILPTDSRIGLLFRHSDYWYPSDFKAWNRSNDEGTLWFVVDRANARLRPFAEYTLKSVRYSRDGSRDGLVHEGNLGVMGEITDQLNAQASMGYGKVESRGGRDTQSLLWELKADHLMNSRTREQITFSRRFSDSGQASQAVDDTIQYRIGRVLGRDFTTWLGVSRYHRDADGSDIVESKNWTALVDFSRNFAQNWNATIRYEHVNWDSNVSENSFNENRISLNIVWNRALDRQYGVDMELAPLDFDVVEPHVAPEFL